jgi:hypothetical protein
MMESKDPYVLNITGKGVHAVSAFHIGIQDSEYPPSLGVLGVGRGPSTPRSLRVAKQLLRSG